MKKRNILSLALVGTLVIGALSACTGGTPADPGTTTPEATPAATPAAVTPTIGSGTTPAPAPAPAPTGEATGKIILATANEAPSLTIAEHNAVAGTYMNKLTNNGLVRIDAATLQPVPDLAVSYAPLNDLDWEFKLRDDVYFHNGDHMTADDVVASLFWVKQFPDCVQYQMRIVNVEKVDDYTVIISTAEPSAMLLTDLAHHGNWIVPKSLIDSGHNFNADPVGSGPYKFVNWTFGDSFDFVANDNYFDTERAPRIKDMTWRVIPEGSSRTIALEAGEVDLIVEVATQDIPRMQADPNIEVFMTPGVGHNFMMINNEIAPFDNIIVRKALDMAIDKEALVGIGMDGLAQPIYNQVTVGFAGNTNKGTNSYDPEGAAALLAEHGIDPASITFDIICSDDAKRRCGEVIQSSLAEIGINVTLSTMDLATYLSVTADGDYEAAIGGFNSSDIMSYLNGVWHGASVGGSNKTRTNDPEINALIDKAAATLDEAERIPILEEVCELINLNVGQIPIYQNFMMRAYNANLVLPELGASTDLNLNMGYWID